jgi:hypothetical protein
VKLGAENRNKVLLAAGLGAVAVIVLAVQMGGFFGGLSSSAASPVALRTEPSPDSMPAPRGGARLKSPARKSPAATLDPSLRFDLLKASEDTKYEGTGRNIFRVFVEPPPRVVKSPVLSQAPQQAGPPPPLPPPPINLKFYGFATPTAGVKRIFLIKNEDVFIAKEGDIVDRRYKVVRISPNAVEILDVLSNNRQSIPLTQG